MSAIDWKALNAKLPFEKTPEGKTKRKELFGKFDNGNGILSLAETDKAMRDVLQIDDLFDAKPAISCAFNAAKAKSKGTKNAKDDFIEFREFRFFLQALRQYFEYFEAFSRVDKNADKRIELVEFKKAEAQIEKWVGKIDAEAEFKKIDKSGGGYILFNEFTDWAIEKNLDLEDDED